MNARKGATGAPLGGRIVRVKPRRYQFNDESCDVCLAVEGSPCTKREWEGRKPGKWVTYREETHKTTALNRGLSWPMNEHEAQSARLRMPRNKNR